MTSIFWRIIYDVTVFERRSTLLTKTTKDDGMKAIKTQIKIFDSEILSKFLKVDKEFFLKKNQIK